MTIQFNEISQGLRVPLFYAEVDASAVSASSVDQPVLLIGQANDGVVLPQFGPIRVSGVNQAKELFGAGSVLHDMYASCRLTDPIGDIWCLPVPVSGSAATGSITVSGTATSAGVISLYIAGKKTQITVQAGQTAAQIASVIDSVLDVDQALPVLSSVASDTVTLTGKYAGVLGNSVHVAINHYGHAAGQVLPNGISIAITAMHGGAGVPSLSAELLTLGDTQYDFMACAYADVASLLAVGAHLTSNWSPNKQLYGHAYTCKRGLPAVLVSDAALINNQHITMVAVEQSTPSSPWKVLGAYVGRTAGFVRQDPARPTQTGALDGVMPPMPSARYVIADRQMMLSNGVATINYIGEIAQIERAVTTYTRNASGDRDTAYIDAETLHTTAYVMRRLKSRIKGKYARHKLGNDGVAYHTSQSVVTPSVIRSELLAEYAELETLGIVEDYEAFRTHLKVERNAQDPNRLDVLFPPDYVNQLRIFAVLNQFRLQY